MKKIIIVAGLGDNGRELALGSAWWRKEGLKPIIFLPNWEKKEGIKPKLVRLLELIDKESNKEPVMLLGISAGASLALNAFMERLDKIEKMVSLCGRLRFGWSRGIIKKKLQEDTLKHMAFKQSVKLLEKNIKSLKRSDRKRVMTVSAKFGDELIPIGTSKLAGANNILIPTMEHVLSIFSGMTSNFEPIRKFLLGEE